MAYTATVYRVVICSPGDVPEEREIIRDLVAEWNSAHARTKQTILEPVGWETHATPAMGNGAQNIISAQLVKDADLLIAVFWTRLGTRTTSHASGTVQEIEEHLALGKRAMIYFSRKPVVPDSLDVDQYRALKDFKASLLQRGLIGSYDSPSEFRATMARDLAAALNEPLFSNGADSSSTQRTEALSSEAISLLETVIDNGRRIFTLMTNSGWHIQIGNRVVADGDRESEKLYSAVEELRASRYLRDIGIKGEAFEVTEKGFRFIEARRSSHRTITN